MPTILVQLPGNSYINLAAVARVKRMAESIIVVYLDGTSEEFGGCFVDIILEALSATRLKIAYRKRS